MSIHTTPHITCHSPAKINLFLKIIGMRDDNYHNLQSVFQYLDWHDTITFTQSSTLEFIVKGNTKNVPHDDSNLVIQAIRLIASYCQRDAGVTITLDKQLPAGGGLGGGSSNAAITLLALNKLWQLQLSLQTLISLGERLGADVPFFVAGNNALVEGKGERLTPVNLAPAWYVLCLNDVVCSTQQVFSCYQEGNWQLTSDNESVGLPAHEGVNRLQPSKLVIFGNQLMVAALHRYPQLERMYQALSSVTYVTMSGSGSSFFALADDEQDAYQLVERLKQSQSGCRFVITKGISHYDWNHVGV